MEFVTGLKKLFWYPEHMLAHAKPRKLGGRVKKKRGKKRKRGKRRRERRRKREKRRRRKRGKRNRSKRRRGRREKRRKKSDSELGLIQPLHKNWRRSKRR